MLIFLILVTKIFLTTAEVYNGPIFNQSDPNSSQHIWHSYTFETGAGNREELYFSNIELDHKFESIDGVFLWKNLLVEERIVIVGLGDNFLLVTTINADNDSFAYTEEVESSAKGLALFQKWNAKVQKVESFLIVATQETGEKYAVKWYQILDKKLKYLWSWPFQGIITHLDVIKINFEPKLLVVNHKGLHKSSADIYSFNINDDLDLWLFEKIILTDIPSSVSVFDNNDNIFFCASFPSLDTIHIFRFKKSNCLETLENKHFVSHQKIFSTGLNSLISFRVGFRWYLAVASKTSQIYYIGENNFFQPVSNLKLGSFNNWLAVPVNTYREDTILLADSDMEVSVVSWAGNEQLKVLGSFTKLACENDTLCAEKMKNISLNKSTAFDFNGQQSIIISTNNGNLFYKLLIKLKPLPDVVTLKLMNYLNMKDSLQDDYLIQKQQIEKLSLLNENATKTFETNQYPESASQKKNFSTVVADLNKLKYTYDSINRDVNKILNELKPNSTTLNGDGSNLFANGPEDGITFHGHVFINELDVSNVNGYDVAELLSDSFRKNSPTAIGGKKTIKKLTTDNVVFQKLEDTLACDIVFSDDPWEDASKNTINGDIVFTNDLTVLNDVSILSEPLRNESYLPHKTSETVYGHLDLDELEVTDDTHIQKTINGKPLILPVHNTEIDILNIVNQVGIDVANVDQNLQIDYINGKNFSSLLQQMIFKPPSQVDFDKIKIDGVFSAENIKVDRLNKIDLTQGEPEVESFGLNENYYDVENDLKRSNYDKKRRVIHVFQNLEILGVLFSNKINNISWGVLNDTIKMYEDNPQIIGTKRFEKIKANDFKLSGTINGRFVDNILNNHTDQSIKFPQTFDKVKFDNLTLNGAWDGLLISELDKIVRLSTNNGKTADLVFEEDCYINFLNVSDFVNNVNVTKVDDGLEPIDGKIELKSLKANNVVLHGSLITNNNINNMDIQKFSQLRVSLKSPEIIDQDLQHHNITVYGNINVETVNLNDVSSIVYSGGDTTLIDKFLNGEIHKIKKLLVKGNITTAHGVNGYDVSKILEKAVRITKPGVVRGNIIFENTINFNNINVTNTIDGFSLKNLEKDIVFKHHQVFLRGPKNFSTLIVTKNMKARSINGHLLQEVASLSGDETMKGLVQINGDVVIRGNLTTYAAINNLTVTDLLRAFSTNVNSFIYSNDLHLNSDKVTIRNLIVEGMIQNVSLEDLLEDAVMKNDAFYVSGEKIFKGEVKFNKNVLVNGLIHGLNFSEFYSNIAFINEPTKIQGEFTLNEGILQVLNAAGDFNSSLINNLDTNEWIEDSIPLDKYVIVQGKKTFENVVAHQQVSVDFINNHLPSAMISLKGKQHIPALALFPRIHTTSDLSVAGLVNKYNLLQEFEDTVLLEGPQRISGKTLFKNGFEVKGNVFVKTVSGKTIDSLITLDTEQTIKSPLVFNGVVTATDVDDLTVINNINLTEWEANAVLLNKEQVLNGLWTVKGKVKTKDIQGEGLLHAVSLPDFSKGLQRGRLLAVETINATLMEYSENCRKIEEISDRFSKLPYLFYQFDIADEIESSLVIDSVITFKINNANYLIVTLINECLSSLYKWNVEYGKFEYLRQINIGSVSRWSVVYRNEAAYLITSSLRNSVHCEENLQQGNIWMFKGNYDKYTHLLTTNAFVDIVYENNTSDEFFTIDDNGVLQEWTLESNGSVSSKFLLNLGSSNYKFIDFRIMGGLAVSNGREIRQITLTEDSVIENNIALTNANLVALPIEGKNLIAVVVKDKIVIYENLLEDKIYSVIHTYRAGSVLWMNYGPEKQAFLIVASHHKLIEVYEYKSVAGLVKRMSIHMNSSKLQLDSLPVKDKYQPDKFVIVIQKKKIIFLRADMMGDFFLKSDSFC